MLADTFDHIDVKSVDGPAQADTSAGKIEEFIRKVNSFQSNKSSLQLKFQKQKLHSWTRKCTKATDSTRNQSLTCKHTTIRQRTFNTRISTRFTHQASRKALSKRKH